MTEAGQPAGVGEALAMLDHALGYLASADATSLPAAAQADVLRALGRAESRQTAARARVLTAFMAADGCADDGHGSAKTWLAWQTRITRAAAAGLVGWARRLAAHPVIAGALAAGELSASWARQICEWTDRLPEAARPDADAIIVQAAAGGADLAGLAGLAEEIYRRCAGPDADTGDGFEDRYLQFGLTWRGTGRLDGGLSRGCAAAVAAVLEALGKKAGPEDARSAGQRRHDALEEACRRLIGAGMVPGRAGQATHIQLHLTLAQLRALPCASQAEAAWAAARASQPGWVSGPEADAAACDASVVPVVCGHVDPAALDQLTQIFLAGLDESGGQPADGAGDGCAGRAGDGCGGSAGWAGHAAMPARPLSPAPVRRLRRALVGLAAEVLSGPGGLAAALRANLAGLDLPELLGPSLPLDIGAASEIIPAHLRRAVTARHKHCAFPGCAQPASVCQIHHLVPRAAGGPTSLPNLVPLCAFHHLIAIHRWGWQLVLNPDATTTATSPDGTPHPAQPQPARPGRLTAAGTTGGRIRSWSTAGRGRSARRCVVRRP